MTSLTLPYALQRWKTFTIYGKINPGDESCRLCKNFSKCCISLERHRPKGANCRLIDVTAASPCLPAMEKLFHIWKNYSKRRVEVFHLEFVKVLYIVCKVVTKGKKRRLNHIAATSVFLLAMEKTVSIYGGVLTQCQRVRDLLGRFRVRVALGRFVRASDA